MLPGKGGVKEERVSQGMGINRPRVCEARQLYSPRTENMSARLECVQGGATRKKRSPGEGVTCRGVWAQYWKHATQVFSWDQPNILFRAGHTVLLSLPPSSALETGLHFFLPHLFPFLPTLQTVLANGIEVLSQREPPALFLAQV